MGPFSSLDVVFDLLLLVVWAGLLAVTVGRYRRGRIDRQSAHLWVAISLVWLAYSLFQVVQLVDGPVALALQVSGLVTFGVGLAVGGRWWRTRGNTRTKANDEPL
jgi:membrane associated rhomboid family serine protease